MVTPSALLKEVWGRVQIPGTRGGCTNDLTNVAGFRRDRFQSVSSRLMDTGGCGNRFGKNGCRNSGHGRNGYDKKGYWVWLE